MSAAAEQWHLAVTAAAALAADPNGLGGAIVRARPGPARDRWVEMCSAASDRPMRRLPGSVDSGALTAQVDLGATVRAGTRIEHAGILADSSDATILIPMAERLQAGVAAHLAAGLDATDGPPMVLLDESAEPDESVPNGIGDRLAISISLDGLALGDLTQIPLEPESIAEAKTRLVAGLDDGDSLIALTGLAARLGIGSLRIPILALRLARVLAALDAEPQIGADHLATATALCLVPRAKTMPSQAEDDPPPPPPAEEHKSEEPKPHTQSDGPLEDRVLEAAHALLPDLALSGTARNRGSAGEAGSGNKQRSNHSGRPVRSRPGRPEGQRMDVFATLCAAAPWQTLRRRGRTDSRLVVLPEDFRIRQFDRPSESVLIFLVDASGSQAASRMAEAKGAVELMLAEAYRRREKVALMAFRGSQTELLLPPTRSLLQAKRRLAVLPGGGPTPLASALVAGREMAQQMKRRGATPYLILLTDGRGNIGLSGEPDRTQAAEDQKLAASTLLAEGVESVLIDTANRPQAEAKALAHHMAAQYLPLPRADAAGISRLIRAGQPG